MADVQSFYNSDLPKVVPDTYDLPPSGDLVATSALKSADLNHKIQQKVQVILEPIEQSPAKPIDQRVALPLSPAFALSRKIHEFAKPSIAIQKHINGIESFLGNFYSLTSTTKNHLAKIFSKNPQFLKFSQNFLKLAKDYHHQNRQLIKEYLAQSSSISKKKSVDLELALDHLGPPPVVFKGETELANELDILTNITVELPRSKKDEIGAIYSLLFTGALWRGAQGNTDSFFLGIQNLDDFTQTKVPVIPVSRQEQPELYNAYSESLLERVWNTGHPLYEKNQKHIKEWASINPEKHSQITEKLEYLAGLVSSLNTLNAKAKKEPNIPLTNEEITQLQQLKLNIDLTEKQIDLLNQQMIDTLKLYESLTGFTPYPESPYILQKFSWKDVNQDPDGTFRSGKRVITLASHDGTQKSIEQLLDLSSLQLSFEETQFVLYFIQKLGKLTDEDVNGWMAANPGKTLIDIFIKLDDPQLDVKTLTTHEVELKRHFERDSITFLTKGQKIRLFAIAHQFTFGLSAKFQELAYDFKDLKAVSSKEPVDSKLAHRKIKNLASTGFFKKISKILQRIKNWFGHKHGLKFENAIAILQEEIKFASSQKIQGVIKETHLAIEGLSKKIARSHNLSQKEKLKYKQDLLSDLELKAEFRHLEILSDSAYTKYSHASKSLVKKIATQAKELNIYDESMPKDIERALSILSETHLFKALINKLYEVREQNLKTPLETPFPEKTRKENEEFNQLFTQILNQLFTKYSQELKSTGLNQEVLGDVEKFLYRFKPAAFPYNSEKLQEYLNLNTADFPKINDTIKKIIEKEKSHFNLLDDPASEQTPLFLKKVISDIQLSYKEVHLEPREDSFLKDKIDKLEILQFNSEIKNLRIKQSTESYPFSHQNYKTIENLLQNRQLIDITDPVQGPSAIKLRAILEQFGEISLFKDFYQQVIETREKNIELLDKSIIPCSLSQGHNVDLTQLYEKIRASLINSKDEILSLGISEEDYENLGNFLVEIRELACPYSTHTLEEHLKTDIFDFDDRATKVIKGTADRENFFPHFATSLKKRSEWKDVKSKPNRKFVSGTREITFRNKEDVTISDRLDFSKIPLNNSQTELAFNLIFGLFERMDLYHVQLKKDLDNGKFSNFLKYDFYHRKSLTNVLEPLWKQLTRDLPPKYHAKLKQTLITFAYQQFLNYTQTLMTSPQLVNPAIPQSKTLD